MRLPVAVAFVAAAVVASAAHAHRVPFRYNAWRMEKAIRGAKLPPRALREALTALRDARLEDELGAERFALSIATGQGTAGRIRLLDTRSPKGGLHLGVRREFLGPTVVTIHRAPVGEPGTEVTIASLGRRRAAVGTRVGLGPATWVLVDETHGPARERRLLDADLGKVRDAHLFLRRGSLEEALEMAHLTLE